MNQPEVAVVITCFDLGRTLDEAIESVRDQTVAPRELVIVDDGSTDVLTLQVLARLERDGYTVVRTPNRGVSAARNTGIARTTAPFIVLLDADDAFEPTYFEQATARLANDRSLAFVSCGMQSVGGSNGTWTPPDPDLVCALSGEVVHISSMFRRELWEAIGGFDESLRAHEEVDFWARALVRGFRGEVIDAPLLRYRVRNGSLYRSAIRRKSHRALMEHVYSKLGSVLAEHVEPLLLAKERFILDQQAHGADLQQKIGALRAETATLDRETGTFLSELRGLGAAEIDFGDLRRLRPISPVWGIDRGLPLDRYYIHQFLERHRLDIRGQVLEMKDAGYTRLFGGNRVSSSDVLDINADNEHATVIADLASPAGLTADTYDCFILTQTLGLIFDVERALAQAFKVLKPGGVLLCTVPASGRISCEDRQLDGDFWRFTEGAVRKLFASAFPSDAFVVTGFGNVLASAAFLYGLSPDDLMPEELDEHDPFFPVVYGVRAVKPAVPTATELRRTPAAQTLPSTLPAGAILMYHRIAEGSTGIPSLRLSPRDFRGHLQHLRDGGYRVVSLHDFTQAVGRPDRLPPMVAITFDDGYAELLAEAVPTLSELGLPATFFVVGESLDGPCEFWWDTIYRIFTAGDPLPAVLRLTVGNRALELPTGTAPDRHLARQHVTEAFYRLNLADRKVALEAFVAWGGHRQPSGFDPRAMSPDALLKLARIPGMSVGAHTEHHLWLPAQTAETRLHELSVTKMRLERLLGAPITSLAYPYGAVDAETEHMARLVGYTAAVTTEPRGADASDSILRLPRLDVSACDTEAFIQQLKHVFQREPAAVPTAE